MLINNRSTQDQLSITDGTMIVSRLFINCFIKMKYHEVKRKKSTKGKDIEG